MKINDIKWLLKKNPKILFIKPYLLLFLPLFVVKMIIRRMIISTTKVYFVETNIDTYLERNKDTDISSKYYISEHATFSDFLPILKKRLEDDPKAGVGYKYEVENRFLQRDKAFCLFENNKSVGYIFIQTKSANLEQIDYKLNLPENTFAFIDLYIFKNSRKKKLHELLYTKTIKYLDDMGFKTFYCWLMEHNQISIKAHVKIGIVDVVKIFTLKTFLFSSNLRIENANFNLSSLIRKS